MPTSSQRYEVVPLDQVQPHPDNPRRGDTAGIAESLDANGWYGAVVAQASTGRILVGNHRWLTLKEAGASEVPVIWLEVDDDRARRILLADNRTGDRADYDRAGLLDLLESMAGEPDALAGTGYDLDALEDLRAVLDQVPTLPPTDTSAHYAETADEEDARVAGLGTRNIHEAGLRELLVVLPLDEHATALERIATLRKAIGPEASSGDAVLGALLAAQPGAVTDALALLREGAVA